MWATLQRWFHYAVYGDGKYHPEGCGSDGLDYFAHKLNLPDVTME